jgi:hypothetical protein
MLQKTKTKPFEIQDKIISWHVLRQKKLLKNDEKKEDLAIWNQRQNN